MLKSIFTPYASLSRSASAVVAAAWIGILLVLWTSFHGQAFPSPTAVLHALGYLITERGLLFELFVSLKLNVISLTIASVISLGLCYLLPLPFMRPLVDMTSLVRFAGFAGLTFTFTVLINDAQLRKVVIMVFSLVPWIVTSLSRSIQSIEDGEYQHARTMKMGHVETTWHVIIRGHLYDALDAIRQNLGIAWAMVATVEGLVKFAGGVGVVMLESQKYNHIDQIFATLTVILALGLVQDLILRGLRAWLCPYASLNERSF